MPAAKEFKAYNRDKRIKAGREDRETFHGDTIDFRRRVDKEDVAIVAAPARGCFSIEKRRGSKPVCSEDGDPTSSTVVVAAHVYFAAELASHSELSRKVIANLSSPIRAYIPKTGWYVSFQLRWRKVR